MSLYYFYRARQGFGALPALIAGAVVLLAVNTRPLKLEPHYDDSAVEVALVAPEPEPQPQPLPEPPPPEPTPVEPVAEQPPLIDAPEAPLPAPPKPVPKPKPKPVVKAEPKPAAKPTPQPAPPPPQVASTPAPAPTPAPAKPAPAAPPAAPKVDSQALEGGYMSGLRNDIDRFKQYPTGRQASLERPTGDVVVWLLVDRAGNVLDAGIQTPASSQLLNRAASNSLRRIKQVKPFPEQAFNGRNEQRFTATFNYSVQ
ncbi:TonB family protein [Pseudomonas sp. NPDC007930]|uniref:energy transducer TonB family protein n=1 Tax=Pseudomonas sp. NPDC007930 TaxID=3364417 RepID=UPI0036E5D960